MIEFKTENGVSDLAISGDISDLFADTCVMIRRIYEAIKKTDPMAAEEYVLGINFVLADKTSPFYTEEVDDNAEM